MQPHYCSNAHRSNKRWIFAKVLFCPPETWIGADVDFWRETSGDAARACLCCNGSSNLSYELYIPRCPLRQGWCRFAQFRKEKGFFFITKIEREESLEYKFAGYAGRRVRRGRGGRFYDDDGDERGNTRLITCITGAGKAVVFWPPPCRVSV